MRGCSTMFCVNGGAPCSTRPPGLRSGSAGATSGIRASASSGPLHAREKADSARAISVPSCSMRADSVESERPSRSVAAAMLTGPGSGARAKWIVSERAARERSSSDSASARTSIAAR